MYVKLLSILKQATFGVAKRKIIVPRTTFDFELDARISQRSYTELGGLFAPFKCFFPISHHHFTRSFTISRGKIPLDIEETKLAARWEIGKKHFCFSGRIT